MNTIHADNFASTVENSITDLEASAKLAAGKEHASQAAHEIKDAGLLKARELRNATVQKVDDVRRMVKNSVQDVRSSFVDQAREKPAQYLMTAFGAGFLLGMMIRR